LQTTALKLDETLKTVQILVEFISEKVREMRNLWRIRGTGQKP
jgi:hypothetical protein